MGRKLTVYDSDVIVCACAWWDNHRPSGMTHEQHLENPKVNCVGQREHDLALMVAEWYRAQARKRTPQKDRASV